MKLIAILCSTCLLAATSPAAELVRYQGRIHYVDVVNESLTGKGRKADGKDGHPLLLDENLQPKPAYLRQVEMLRGLASARSANPATQASSAVQAASGPPKPWTLGARDGRQCLITPDGKPTVISVLTGIHRRLMESLEKEGRLAQ